MQLRILCCARLINCDPIPRGYVNNTPTLEEINSCSNIKGYWAVMQPTRAPVVVKLLHNALEVLDATSAGDVL